VPLAEIEIHFDSHRHFPWLEIDESLIYES
jgi:hypothetical protein